MDNNIEKSIFDNLCFGYKADFWLSSEKAESSNIDNDYIVAQDWFFVPSESCTRYIQLYSEYMVIYTDDFEPQFLRMMELDLVKVNFVPIGRAYKIQFIKNR